MPLRPDMEPSEYLDILRRRKWLIVFSFLLILFAAMVYCVLVPDQYESRTKILIIPPAVAEGMVRSTVNLSTRDRLAAIEQDILGRPTLLGVIQEVGISRLGFKGMSEDDMVDKMRRRDLRTNDHETEPDRNVNTFVLSFLHENPKVAQEVASSLSSLFIGENIKLREDVTRRKPRVSLDQQLEETRRTTRAAGGEDQAVQDPVRRGAAAAGAVQPEPAPKAAGPDQEQLRLHRAAAGSEGVHGKRRSQRWREISGRESGSVGAPSENPRPAGAPLRAGLAKRRNWRR